MMLVIATQSMATRDGGVAPDDAIECTDAQGKHLINVGLARLPDGDDGEPTPRQIRTAFKWPSDEHHEPQPQFDGDVVEPTEGKEPASAKPLRSGRPKRGKDATTNQGSAAETPQ